MGDEGKGKITDLLSENYDIIARYQGGNNAGHTVVLNKNVFIFNFYLQVFCTKIKFV